MDEADVFPDEAAGVAMQAIKDGVARKIISYEEAFDWAKRDIEYSRTMFQSMIDTGFVKEPPLNMLQEALEWAIQQVA